MNANGAAAILLSNSGRTAYVDDADADRASSLRWYLDSRGYAAAHLPGTGAKIQMHRYVLGLPKFVPGGDCVDHINGDRLDNRRANLRLCSRSQNRLNAPAKSGGTSRFKGVDHFPRGNRWKAQIQFEGRKEYLGLFANEEDAARAYDARARELFGDFARLNFG